LEHGMGGANFGSILEWRKVAREDAKPQRREEE
jgi:hypothetical protein